LVTEASLLARARNYCLTAVDGSGSHWGKYLVWWYLTSDKLWLLTCHALVQRFHFGLDQMTQVVNDAQHEFWRPPAPLIEVAEQAVTTGATPTMAEACLRCGTEFMIGSRFCYACGEQRPERNPSPTSPSALVASGFLADKMAWVRAVAVDFSWQRIKFPAWLRYLHFHEIKRWVGLPTASLIAFFAGLGCIAGAIGVSLFFKAQTMAEFQAIQMWRIEWLLAATAAFVAGILLKKPSNKDND
jgi:hypothetical protein